MLEKEMKRGEPQRVRGFPRARSSMGDEDARRVAEEGKRFLRRVLRAKSLAAVNDARRKKPKLGEEEEHLKCEEPSRDDDLEVVSVGEHYEEELMVEEITVVEKSLGDDERGAENCGGEERSGLEGYKKCVNVEGGSKTMEETRRAEGGGKPVDSQEMGRGFVFSEILGVRQCWERW